jgi:hypothetical protein
VRPTGKEEFTVANWEYCILSNPASGTDAVTFSHRQREGLVSEFSGRLGKGLKAENSNNGYLHINLNHAQPVSVAGILGNEEWELVSHAVLTGGHEYWTFKREYKPAA